MISLSLGAGADALKRELQQWLADNPPPQETERMELDDFVSISRKWQRKLAAARWVAVHWPQQFGGRGLSLVEEALVQEVLAAAGAPQLINLFGLTMVGPVLIAHGTPEQQARFLPAIMAADEIWCQGFSEPDAGSDLASLTTSAVRDGDYWVLQGQKVWTSFAHVADWCFVLARTSKDVPKHKGLSYFLVPMKSPGIRVRPLEQISRDREFNEVFFENVRIPADHIVGQPGEGWKIAISTLMYERVILTFSRHLQSEAALNGTRQLLAERFPDSDAALLQYGRLQAQNMAVRALALRHLASYSNGQSPGPEGSLDKLFWSESFQEICETNLRLLGADGIVERGEASYRDGIHQHRYLYSRGRTIAAGTSEIQRSIIAERLLGLPRER
ncbi:MAG: acyl-CoA dehydrogenase family protein [Bdellovibrionales bacterium]|nr:acyl-CoA dehydrogenase family protein [Bdellovibrionales bacterium]